MALSSVVAMGFLAAACSSVDASAVAGQPIYTGTAHHFVDRSLPNGEKYRDTVTAINRAESSSSETIAVVPVGNSLRPVVGTRVTAPPLLTWSEIQGANYYNIQLWQGHSEILSSWPARASFQLEQSWKYRGKAHSLTPGDYTWYVWPGFGRPSQNRYGRLIGKSSFVVRPPRSLFGIQAWQDPGRLELARMQQGGVGVLRSLLLWQAVEPTPGARDWGQYDTLIGNAARDGIVVLPVILGSPAFAASRPQFPPTGRSALAAYSRFLGDAVARYGSRGTFWAANPDIPYHPVTAWQVWNEPSLPAYWNLHPSAKQYAALVRRSRTAIKSKDPRARVVLAGIPESRLGVPMTTYLTQLYSLRGFRRSFDVIAVHPYAASVAGVNGALVRIRGVMRRYHDSRKQIWLTELGWATAGPKSKNKRSFVVGIALQAERLRQTWDALVKLRLRDRIGLLVWFSFRDRVLDRGEPDWWAPHTGLFDLAGNPKPAWRAFVSETGGIVGSGPLPPPGTP